LGLGQSPADKRFGAHWSQKVKLWWQQFLLIFLRTLQTANHDIMISMNNYSEFTGKQRKM